MSTGEKSVLGALLVSVGIGVFQLSTSPWGASRQEDDQQNSTKGQGQMAKTTTGVVVVNDGVTKVDYEKSSKKT